MRAQWLRLRHVRLVDAIVDRAGPAVWRAPFALRRRAVRQRRIPRRSDISAWSHGAEELVVQRIPDSFGAAATLTPLALGRRRLPPPFVAELRNATLVGRHATPFTPAGRMLLTPFRDAVGFLGVEPQRDLEAWVAGPAAMSETKLEAVAGRPVCSLVGRFDVNYFHWLTEQCAMLEGLEAYARTAGEAPLVLVRARAPAFASELLELLGVDRERVVAWPEPWSAEPWHQAAVPFARVGRLVIASLRGHRYGLSPASLRWLRARLLTRTCPAVVGARLYVQRPATAWRAILNEAEVRAVLSAHGFTVLRPHELSVLDQLNHFAGASMIVSLHGAGLTNVIAAPNAGVIELIGSYGGPEYLSLCSGLGNPYARVECAARGSDVIVDLPALEAAVAHVEARARVSSGNAFG